MAEVEDLVAKGAQSECRDDVPDADDSEDLPVATLGPGA